MQFHRAFTGVYALLLLAVTAVGYVPGLTDAQGNLFGVFRLTWYNDALHLASAAWAIGACLASAAASLLFLRVFGALYLADGLLGLATGSGFLDLGIVIWGVRDYPLMFKVYANAPHILGGLGALVASLVRR